MPFAGGLKKLLTAAEAAGVSQRTRLAVETAATTFEAFSKRTAGDRAAFEAMAAGVSSEQGGEKISLAQRRAAYRAMSPIVGSQVDLMYYGCIVRRTEDGEAYDSASVMMLKGLRRLRPAVKLSLYGYHRDPSGTRTPEVEEALDGSAEKRYGMPVLPGYSTMPLPQVEVEEMASGFTSYNTVGGDIGAQSSVDCTIGTRGKGVFMTDVDGRRLSYWSLRYTRRPAGMGIQEVLVHRDSFGGVKPELMVFQAQDGLSQQKARDALQFPVEERLVKVGSADAVGLTEVGRYGEMWRDVAAKMGWDLSEFDVWRVKLGFPVYSSEGRIWFYVE